MDLGAMADVHEVHDLHLWTLTSGMDVATAHLVVGAGADHARVLDDARRVLASRHGIEHVTVQIEGSGLVGCPDLGW